MTVAIAYSAGAYGTYLEWCLTTLCSKNDIVSPFKRAGNSHGYIGKHLYDFRGWQKFRSKGRSAQFVRLHPKIYSKDSITDHLNQLCNEAEFVIHLRPDSNSVVLCLNNSYTKIRRDWWGVTCRNNPDFVSRLFNNWPINSGTSIDDIPIWIRREFLSYQLINGYFTTLEWHDPNAWQQPNGLVVSVTDLLCNFEQTLNNIKEFCNLNFARPVSDLAPYHAQNLSQQTYLTHDKLTKDIINAVTNDQELVWEPLSLVSECWIQYQLRELGFEIRCHGLDTFPTSSVQLKELLYPI